MDQETIDRLQSQAFQTKLATVEASKLQEAARRVKRTTSTIRVDPQRVEQRRAAKKNAETS
jgi:hypothetical protein